MRVCSSGWVVSGKVVRALSIGGLREGFWGHSERQWGPPQVKHPVAGGLAVEGGRRSPEAGDGGGDRFG